MPRRSLIIAAVAIVVTLVSAAVAGAQEGRTTSLGPGGYRVKQIPAAVRTWMTGRSWHPGCPVTLDQLRLVAVPYWGFDGRRYVGHLVVNAQVATAIGVTFVRLYGDRWPFHHVNPVDVYGANDYQSIDHDNTSAFNCRNATGTSHWSEHAYGLAVDVDPLENPYTDNGRTTHPGSVRYLNRSLTLPGMVHPGDFAVTAFARIGWGWGGSWSGSIRDLQHFSSTGT